MGDVLNSSSVALGVAILFDDGEASACSLNAAAAAAIKYRLGLWRQISF